MAKQAHGEKQPSSTKRGPGRYHVSGHKKASPVKAAGAPKGFVQRFNPARKTKNELRDRMSARQFRKWLKRLRADVSRNLRTAEVAL